MSLRERLERGAIGVGAGVFGSANMTGAGVYLALARLESLLRGRVEEYNPQLAASSLSAIPSSILFVSDFTIEERSALEAELFTASAVGAMLVGLGKSEGVIVDDDARGLGVRVKAAVSPALCAMLQRFSECLDRAALAVIGSRAGNPLLALSE